MTASTARDLVFVGDVSRLVSNRAAAFVRLDLLDGRRQPVGIAADDHHCGPGGYQPGGHPFADSTAAAGNQVCPVFERKLHASSVRLREQTQNRTLERRIVRFCVCPPGVYGSSRRAGFDGFAVRQSSTSGGRDLGHHAEPIGLVGV